MKFPKSFWLLPLLLLRLGLSAQSDGSTFTPLDRSEVSIVQADLKGRLTKDLPEEESDLIDERNWLRNMKARVQRSQLVLEGEKHSHTGPKSDLEQLRGELMVVVEKIKAVDCANTAVAQKKLQESYNKYASLRSGYSHIIDAIDQQGANFSREWLQVESRFDELAAFFVTNGRRPSRSFSQGSCEEVVALFNEASLGSDIDNFFTKRRSSMDGEEADLIEREKAYTELSSEMAEYESILDKAIADSKNKRSALDNLYIIVLILVVMSVGSIAMIRIFPYNLMKEWIESGQVIQFVTVTIILIVIVVLGLTGLLSENSLGTLLGAIGGYVLSQGVGRAAAMNAKKKEQDKETKPSEGSSEDDSSK